MNDFERVMVKSFNTHFAKNNVRAFAHRLKQSRFAVQLIDVLVDSLDPDLYAGIECKSISVEKGANAIYFSQHFTTDKKGVHQIERISDYITQTGRRGFLAVELRNGGGHGKEAYLIPWQAVEKRYSNHDTRITLEEIRDYPELKREGSKYNVSDF